jgi:hypothetical protein
MCCLAWRTCVDASVKLIIRKFELLSGQGAVCWGYMATLLRHVMVMLTSFQGFVALRLHPGACSDCVVSHGEPVLMPV